MSSVKLLNERVHLLEQQVRSTARQSCIDSRIILDLSSLVKPACMSQLDFIELLRLKAAVELAYCQKHGKNRSEDLLLTEVLDDLLNREES